MKNWIFLSLFCLTLSLSAQKAEINWMTIEEAEAAVAQEPRKVFIDVYTDWCGWCKRMDKNTFQNPGLAEYVNENFYAVKLDGEEKDSLTFRGETYGFVKKGRRGYNELPAVMLDGRLSYPTIVFLDEELNMIQPIPGYQAPQVFEQIITYMANDVYKTESFEDYKEKYETKISKN